MTPRVQWVPALQKLGFSAPAAESMARMTGITLDQQYEVTVQPIRGATALQAYLQVLVKQESAEAK